MAQPTTDDILRWYFTDARAHFLDVARELVDDADAVVADAEQRFASMLPTTAYADRPGHPMAGAVFGCAAYLSLYLALSDRNVDVHTFGRTLLARIALEMRSADVANPPDRGSDETWLAVAEESQRDQRRGEFVFELLPGDRPGVWGMNIKSCAICHHFAQYGAMELVPYMCATDDIQSDRAGQGLRRTGTIALGAHECDFRYDSTGEPLRIAEQYPDKIRIPGEGDD